MSVTLVNDCVLFHLPPNWAGTMKPGRRWQSRAASGLTGKEDRMSGRDTAFQSLQFDWQACSLSEAVVMNKAVKLAEKSGRAACPLWPRAQYLAGACDAGSNSVAVQGRWQWKPGDYAFFTSRNHSDFGIVLLTAGTSWNRLVWDIAATPLGYLFHHGDQVFPVIFGAPDFSGASYNSGHYDELTVTVAEPVGEGAILASSCGVPQEIKTLDDEVTLSLVTTDTCPVSHTLNWTPYVLASGYEVQNRQVGVTEWTDLPDETGTSLPITYRPWRVSEEYRVRAIFGNEDTPWTDPVEVPAITIEGVMRALSDRMSTAGWSVPTWPGGSYPDDGDYDGIDEATEVSRIQTIVDELLNDSFLLNYAQEDVAGQAGTTIAVYSTAVEPFSSIPATINSGNRVAALRLCAQGICALQYLLVPATVSAKEYKEGNFHGAAGPTGSHASSALAIDEAEALYTASSWAADIGAELALVVASVGNSPVDWNPVDGTPDPFWTSITTSVRCKMGADFSGINGQGNVDLCVFIKPPDSDGVHTGVGGNVPVYNDVDNQFLPNNTWQSIDSMSLPQGAYLSEYLGNYQSAAPAENIAFGWEVTHAKFQVKKLNTPSLLNWAYYP